MGGSWLDKMGREAAGGGLEAEILRLRRRRGLAVAMVTAGATVCEVAEGERH